MTKKEFIFRIKELCDIFETSYSFNPNDYSDDYWTSKYGVHELFIHIMESILWHYDGWNIINVDDVINSLLLIFKKKENDNIETDEEAFDRIYHLIYNILELEGRRKGYLTWNKYKIKLIRLFSKYDLNKPFYIEKYKMNEINEKYNIYLETDIKNIRKKLNENKKNKKPLISWNDEDLYNKIINTFLIKEKEEYIPQNCYDNSYKAFVKLMQINNKLEKGVK